MISNATFDYVVPVNDAQLIKRSLTLLNEQGVVAIRGIADAQSLNTLSKKVFELLEKPALLGSAGYYQKDPHKKLFSGFLTGKESLHILLNENIIDICEKYLGDEVLLQEIFVKHDLGDNRLYFPIHCHTGEYRLTKNDSAFSVGMILYLHDTVEGAFCYAPGTHHWNYPHGGELKNYPREMRQEILEKLQRINGKRGDIVLFDHRGFHGPEQPVKKSRTVFLGGFHAAGVHANKVKTETLVYANHLAGLSAKQLQALGINAADAFITAKDNHLHRLSNPMLKLRKRIDRWLRFYFKIQLAKEKFSSSTPAE